SCGVDSGVDSTGSWRPRAGGTGVQVVRATLIFRGSSANLSRSGERIERLISVRSVVRVHPGPLGQIDAATQRRWCQGCLHRAGGTGVQVVRATLIFRGSSANLSRSGERIERLISVRSVVRVHPGPLG